MVSVIIPVYNGQRTIHRCLESVKNQTYEDIEIIVVNDGSMDRSREIIDSYFQSDNKSVIIHKNINEGIEKARHTGIAVSKGQYLAFIDQDDYIEKNAIEKMINAMMQYDADLVQCRSTSFITMFNCIKVHIPMKKKVATVRLIEKEDIMNQEYLSFFGFGSFGVQVWSKLYKKEYLNDLRTGNLLYGDDLYLNMQIFPKLNRICVLPDVLYHYERQGTTSKYIPMWMEESKRLFRIKVDKAKELQSEKAMLYSSIELRNCFKVHVESMILFKVDSEEGIKYWIKQELQDNVYDIFEWLRSQKQGGHSAIDLAIINKDVDAIYKLCRKSVLEWNWKKIARRLLVHLS